MRSLVLGVLAAAAVSVSAAAAASTVTHHKCGNQGTAVHGIQTTNATCKTAHKVVTADLQGKRYDGWKCSSKRSGTNKVKVTCSHTGAGKVTWTVTG